MKKITISAILATILAMPSLAGATGNMPGQWLIHNTFDYFFKETVVSPERTYMLTYAQMYYPGQTGWEKPYANLFCYDRNTHEIEGYNASNHLNGNIIHDIAYNSAKGYLLIIYDNCSIDLLYDDDTVYNISGLTAAMQGVSKTVNSITFDAAGNRAYLATNFGYVAIDDNKHDIAEIKMYDRSLNAVSRVGDYLMAGTGDGLFMSPLADGHSSFASFSPVEGASGSVSFILPLTDDSFGLVYNNSINVARIAQDGSVEIELKETTPLSYFSECENGYFLRRNGCSYQLDKDGNLNKVYTDKTGYGNTEYGTWDMKEFYFPVSRTCLAHLSYNGNYTWTECEGIAPDAPASYSVFSLTYSPVGGMLAGNGTFNRFYPWEWMNYTSLISGYKDGKWITHTATINPPTLQDNKAYESYGPVIDPLDPNTLWIGTRRSGLITIDMRDGSYQIYAHPSHSAKNLPGFHAVFPTSIYWTDLCNVSAPSFDAQGNLWCVFNPSHANTSYGPVYCWKAEDRKAGNVSAFKEIPVKGYGKHYNNLIVTATKHPNSPDFLVFGPTTRYFDCFYLFNHGGTIDDTSDDVLYSYTKFIDQDGNNIPYTFFNFFFEDPSTGYIWVGTDANLFYFDPNEALAAGDNNGMLRVKRPLVTDSPYKDSSPYLLSGYDITAMTIDGAGRKWFGTNGEGVIVTNAEGTQIQEKFDTKNSKLPSDIVFGLGYDPSMNAMWIGNQGQTATYLLDESSVQEEKLQVVAFPNPVRPDYQGYVSIQGLTTAQNAKVVDAAGNVVALLDKPVNGVTVWDMTDTEGKHVPLGVYYIKTSDKQPVSEATKIKIVL